MRSSPGAAWFGLATRCLLTLGWTFGLSGASLALAGPPTWIWANPIPNGNNLIDLAYTNGLYVQVAERGQVYTSFDLDFWVRRTSHTTNALRAVTFFGNRIVITGERGTVLYADALTNFHSVNLGTTDWLEGVAASPNLVVAVGDNAAIYTSPNGADWQRQSAPFAEWLRSVAHGAGVYIVVGENGRIAGSLNGVTWQILASGTTANLNKVAWITDRFWIVGDAGTVLVSETGRTWTRVNSGATNDLYAVAGNTEARLLVGDTEVRLGERLSYWPYTLIWSDELDATKTFPAPPWTYFNAIWDGSTFIIGGRSGMLAAGFKASAEATKYSWATLSESIRTWLWDIVQVPGLFVAVGDHSTILTSEDGAHWELEWAPSATTNSIFLGVGGTPDGLLAVGNQGAIVFGPNQWTNWVTTNAMGTNWVVTTNPVSTLGLVWQAIDPRPTVNDLQGVCNYRGQWVVTGGTGAVLTSDNGTNWVVRSTPTTAFLSSVTAFPDGLVAVGDLGTILTSPDGITWTAGVSHTTNWLYRVRYLRGSLFAVGQNGTILASPNGLTWTAQTSGTDRWLNDVAFLDGAFYIAGTQGTVLVSTNAIQWTLLETVSGKSLYSLAAYRHQLVAVGIEGVILRAQPMPVQIIDYARTANTNRFVLSGLPGAKITLDSSTNLQTWTPGLPVELLDTSGLLFYQESIANTPAREFYCPTP